MKKFAKLTIVAVVLLGVVLSFASCSFFTPSYDEMVENLRDEGYTCSYSYDKSELEDYDEELESKYGCTLKGEVINRCEFKSGSTFIRMYEFKKRSDAMTMQQELYDDFMGTTHYGTGYIYRYFYIIDGILLETSSTSAAKAALDDAYVLVNLDNATPDEIMNYFTGLFS